MFVHEKRTSNVLALHDDRTVETVLALLLQGNLLVCVSSEFGRRRDF